MATSIIVFLAVYGLYSLSGILFPTDLSFYATLNKPSWNPPRKWFGIVWGILYALIALSITIVYMKTSGFKEVSRFYLFILIINYFANQAFSYFFFKIKHLNFAFIDALIIAISTFLLIYATIPYSKLAAWLLVPYLIWSCFATLLAWTIAKSNQ